MTIWREFIQTRGLRMSVSEVYNKRQKSNNGLSPRQGERLMQTMLHKMIKEITEVDAILKKCKVGGCFSCTWELPCGEIISANLFWHAGKNYHFKTPQVELEIRNAKGYFIYHNFIHEESLHAIEKSLSEAREHFLAYDSQNNYSRSPEAS